MRATRMLRIFGFFVFGFNLMACGSSKSGYDPGPMPNIGKRQRAESDKNTLQLKNENLKLTHFTQTWKLNKFTQDEGAEKYLRLEKVYTFPIQFSGWVALDNVKFGFLKCADPASEELEFVLEDDHNGISILQVGEKVPVSLEKLYDIRVAYPNSGLCGTVDIQFGILYGTNE